MAPSLSPIRSHHVAVIGAGAAGLVAARELRREGHSVVVFERQNKSEEPGYTPIISNPIH
ncbi:putative FAD/NAD(P)-binding domain superfamily [Arabidopsis thaliana]